MFSSLFGEEPAMRQVLQQMLQDQPFVPFRIHMTGRYVVDVLRPETAELGKGVLTLYAFDQDEPGKRRMTSMLSIDHIVSIEELLPDEPSVVAGNQ